MKYTSNQTRHSYLTVEKKTLSYLRTYFKKVQIEGHYNYKIKRRQQTVFTAQMRRNKNKMNVNEGQQWHKV